MRNVVGLGSVILQRAAVLQPGHWDWLWQLAWVVIHAFACLLLVSQTHWVFDLLGQVNDWIQDSALDLALQDSQQDQVEEDVARKEDHIPVSEVCLDYLVDLDKEILQQVVFRTYHQKVRMA